jgi:hypothetical protein
MSQRNSMVLPMQALDLRPPSLLRQRNVSSRMAVGGVLAAIGAHLVVPGAIAAALALLSASGVGKTPHNVIVEEHVVEARFVKLGKKLDPHQIPNRKVPIKSTAPQPGVAVSKVMEPPKPNKPDAGPPPENPTEDLLTRLGDRAQTFAEIAQRQEQEGDPNGVPDGTETTAKAGDLYMGQLVAFFKRGWTIPNTLTDTSQLVTRISVEITPDKHVGPHQIVKSSGNALFDQSVEDRINQLRTQGTTLPDPPPEVADKFAGTWSLGVNFKP